MLQLYYLIIFYGFDYQFFLLLSDFIEPPVTPEPLSSITVTPTTSQQCQTSPTFEQLRPEVEETKEEEVKSTVEKMEEDVDESKEDRTLEEASNKCTEVNVSERESVEVKIEEPVQECEEQNTQSEECNETSESDNFKHVCDISTNEEIKSKEETVPREETEAEKHEDIEIAQDIEEDVNIQERSSVNGEPSEPTVNQNQLSFQHEVIEGVNLDETESQVSQEDLEDKCVESNHDHATQETCDRSINSDAHNSELMEVEEEKSDFHQIETSNLNIQNVPVTVQSNECESVQHSPQPDMNLNTTEQEKENQTNTLEETSLASEVEIINAQRFPEVVSEENLDEERYEADINDSLEYVNEETSTSLQNSADVQLNPELTNNQDSIDSQGKEDSCNYSVKMEDDLDINDTCSNMQSQDSQDTRIDEESSCQQESDLMIPDSEVSGITITVFLLFRYLELKLSNY